MGFRQLDHLKGPRAVGHALQKPTLLQGHNEPVNAGFGLQVQRFLHFFKRRWNAFLLQTLIDEQQQLELFAGQHFGALP